MMKRIAASAVGLVLLAFWASPAAAQSSCASIATGAVLTAAQWQSCFQKKIDFPIAAPLSVPGLTVTGFFTATGLVTNADLANSSVVINGVGCTLGSSCAGITATATSMTPGTTTVVGGTNGRVLYDNSGVLGEYPVTGSGNVVMSASPTFTGTIAAAGATFTTGISLAAKTTINGNAAAVPAGISGAPILVLQGADGAGGNGVTIYNHSDASELYLAASLGTGASPTLVTSGTRLGRIYGYGYDGTNYDQATRISFAATQDFSPTHNGAQILFYTTPNNSTTQTLALTIDQDQSLALAGALKLATTLTFTGSLPTGSPSTYACFTAGGALISSVSAC